MHIEAIATSFMGLLYIYKPAKRWEYLAKTVTCLEKEKEEEKTKFYRPFFQTIIGWQGQRAIQATPRLK